jgi:NTP pyrophosphatase (non-canonical NTP hydrolase)
MSEKMFEVLANVVVINLKISLWSGRKKLRPADLKGVNLPPAKLASLGSKRVYDPEALRVFASLKCKAERICLNAGTRFLSGYAIPEEKVPALLAELVEIREEYTRKKSEFLNKYQSILSEWIEEAGEWADIIRKAVETEEAACKKLSFGFTPFKVGPCAIENKSEDADSMAQDLLESQVNGLAGQLLKEIGQSARQAFEASFKGRTEVTRKALRPFNTISDKLKGLMFVAPQQIVGLLANIKAAIDALPKNGPITGAPLMGLIGVLTELGDINGFVQARESLPEAEGEQIDLFAEYDIETPVPAMSMTGVASTGTKPSGPGTKSPEYTDQVDTAPGAEQGETLEKGIVQKSDLSVQPQNWFY